MLAGAIAATAVSLSAIPAFADDPTPSAPPAEAAADPAPPPKTHPTPPPFTPVPPPWWRVVAPEPPPAPRVDPLRNMGIAITSMSAAGLIGSSILIGTGKQVIIPPPCPPAFGCTADVKNSSGQIHGAGLLGASLFGAMIGAPLWAIGSLEEPIEAGKRQSDSRFLAGVGLTVFGVASTAAGAFSGLADRHGDFSSLSVPAAVLGTVSTLVGLPLWASGSKRVSDNDQPFGPKLVRRSRGMMAGGIALTIIGSSIASAGAIMLSFGSNENGFRAFAGSMSFASLGLVMAGIPMWYFGQEKIPERPWDTASAPLSPPATAARKPPPITTPEIQVGPGSMMMRFLF